MLNKKKSVIVEVDPTLHKLVQPKDKADQMVYREEYIPKINSLNKFYGLKLIEAEESLARA